MRFAARLITALAAACAASFACASPPPPPPAFVETIARQILASPTQSGFDSYAALFAKDLIVTLNGSTIAKGKDAWLAIERARLGKVDRFVYGFAADRGSILVMDRFDDRSAEHCPAGDKCNFDPRWMARAVRYEIGPDRLVHRVRILQSNSIMQTP